MTTETELHHDESPSSAQGSAADSLPDSPPQPDPPVDESLAGADVDGETDGAGADGDTLAEAEPDPAQLIMLLEDARARADQTHDQLLRARAEIENMARRQARELENAHKYALDQFVRELLPVRDSLELGLSAANAPDADLAKLREGTVLTLKLFGDVMAKFGVERIVPEGEPFNPEFHQAMSLQPRADVAPNTVVAVIQPGYTLNGRLVRPALVMVSSNP